MVNIKNQPPQAKTISGGILTYSSDAADARNVNDIALGFD